VSLAKVTAFDSFSKESAAHFRHYHEKMGEMSCQRRTSNPYLQFCMFPKTILANALCQLMLAGALCQRMLTGALCQLTRRAVFELAKHYGYALDFCREGSGFSGAGT
jgi:hypothetical protein